jgi:hypothetical protein
MRGFNRSNSAKKWARFALKAGLLLTDAKLWGAINDQLRDRAGDMTDEARRRYADATDRLQDAQDALRGRNHWVGPTLNFVGGVGLGIGLGLLLAPVSGEEARSAVRGKVVDMKNKMRDMASGISSDVMESAGA